MKPCNRPLPMSFAATTCNAHSFWQLCLADLVTSGCVSGLGALNGHFCWRAHPQVQRLQLLLHKHWQGEAYPDLAELALANCGTVQKREELEKAIAPLPLEQLRLLVCTQLRSAVCPG